MSDKIQGEQRETFLARIGELTAMSIKLRDLADETSGAAFQISRALELPAEVAEDKLQPAFERAETAMLKIRELNPDVPFTTHKLSTI